MTVSRFVCGACVLVVLVFGAAGWSSAQDNEFCSFRGPYAVEGASTSTSYAAWPPGWRCEYSLPSGRQVALESGSAGLFVGMLGFELLFVISLVRWWPRVPRPARLAAATALSLLAAGAGGLLGGFLFAMYAGVLVGIPLAYFTDRALLRAQAQLTRRAGLAGATVAALAGLICSLLWLYGLGGVASFAIAVSAAALIGTLAPARRLRPVSE